MAEKVNGESNEVDLDEDFDPSFTLREEDLLPDDESFEQDMLLKNEEVYSSGDDLPNSNSADVGEIEQPPSESEDEQLGEGNNIASMTTASSSTQKRKYNRKQLTRKRQRNPDQWEKNVQKKQVNLGLAYKSSFTNKDVPARSMKRPCALGCRKKCQERIDEGSRILMFNKLWSIQDHALKYEFLLRLITDTPKEPGEYLKKAFSREYSLENSERKSVEVCQTMFLHTFGISMQFVNTACKKRRNGDVILKDNRGSSANRPREIPAGDIEAVIKHINAFPRVESHYVRSDSSKEYLEETLNISIMYRLYVDWAKEQGLKVVKKHVHNDVFCTKFNLSFFKPKKDQCDTCTSYKNATQEDQLEQQSDYNTHLKNKATSRDLKRADIALAKAEENVCTACFDYQKVLSTPRTENSCLYYKRKLSVMNFTIYDCGEQKGYCYCYDENEANRGSNEVGSCLLDFAVLKKEEGKSEINLYCDNCGGQNKNKGVLSTLEFIAINFGIKLKMTFLEPGHTQNQANSVHATIERDAAMRKIFVPEDWYRIIEEAKITGHPYEVRRITYDDIYDFKELSSGLNWSAKMSKKGADGKIKNGSRQIPISKIKQVEVSSEFKHSLKYETSFDEEYKTLGLRTRNDHYKIERYTLRKAYTSVQGIPKLKRDDLLALCESNIIPPDRPAYHLFYKSILIESKTTSESTSSGSTNENGEH